MTAPILLFLGNAEAQMLQLPLINSSGVVVAYSKLDIEFKLLLKQIWYLRRDGYAMRNHILLHRYIIGAVDRQLVDHVNGDKLDNRKSNLRLCTHSENLSNRGIQSNNTSGYKGVTWHKSRNKWRAFIIKDRLNIHLGYYTNEREAAIAYNKAALHYHKEFALLNEIV